MKMWMVAVVVVVLAVVVVDVDCNRLFFPLGSLNLHLPFPSQKHPHPILTLPALPFTPSPKHNLSPLTYTFTDVSHLLGTYNTSSVYFNDTVFSELKPPADQPISGWLEVQDEEEGYNRTQVTVVLLKEVKCEKMMNELCFWEEATYTVPENYPGVRIGELASGYLKKTCPEYNVTYLLLNHTDSISIANDFLHTIRPLDRDHSRLFRGPGNGSRRLGVVCTVVDPAGRAINITRTLQLNLLDVNDHPPAPEFNTSVIEVLARNEIELNESLTSIDQLFFRDWDSFEVNDYKVTLLGDDAHLFNFTYKIWPVEHQTAVHFKLSARNGSKIPDEGYEVVVLVNDTAMDPKYGDSTANLTIHFLPPGTVEAANFQKKNTLYPEEMTILRTAGMLARVAQPITINVSECRFQLPGPHKAFNVTIKGGIIFVINVTELRMMNSSTRLEIKWRNKTSDEYFSDYMSITLVKESNPTCTHLTEKIHEWGHCASHTTMKSCEKTCGLGSGAHLDRKWDGHGRCKWNGGKGENQLTTLYSTCTPDRVTCPDGRCDEMEELHHWLCPQDCTRHVSPPNILNEKFKPPRGIYKGIGVCRCDTLDMCYCRRPQNNTKIILPPPTPPTTPSTPPPSPNTSNVSRRTDDTTLPVTATSSLFPNCGAGCVLGVAGGALFLLAAGSLLAACWRRRRVQDAARRDRKLAAAAAAQHTYTPDTAVATPSDVGGLGSGALLLNFEMGGSVYAQPKIIPVVDSKWEFPRENLRIEQTLGEGEFGRVLRARALEISNIPGYTTVAVKTLKEGAREAELADLMSEYQLLKEVSHPNVIRLLGACTLPGGPVYLVIEFAELGSLRNYLRRSRHLESEGRTPNSTALMLGENEPTTLPNCKITPRDILSFAWQISKGMNYLNDMKLVHRDLAARNVLLAADMICKISDFGLTRDVYEDDTYLKRTKGRVPVKWMAPESLADHIYNSKSDVWSFGILLWELVTLGASPYPGVAVQNLFHLLRSGYRMEKPENCSTILYKIMRMCWCEDPNDRPSFRSLMMKFETMLADGVDYLDLNPRTVHNRTYFTSISEALITPEEADESTGYGNLTLMQPDTVNFLSQPQNETKCAEIDKLQVLWKRPDSPKASNTRSYENEEKTQELHHYESPIKCKNKTEGLRTPTNDRPQSYIDMAGTTSEVQTLLRSKSKDELETVSKVTSL